jgi:nitric-oxide synthase
VNPLRNPGLSNGTPLHDSPLGRRLRRISALERQEEARAFLDTFHDTIGAGQKERQRRRAEVRRELSRHRYYEHTPEELAFGARLAWRNHGRCIGRLLWESLEVVDCRAYDAPEAIAERMSDHLDQAFGGGRIRPVISIFPPVMGDHPAAWIESPQITQYACHVLPDGSLLGDRQNVEATRIARSMGWKPPEQPGRFDLLPYFVRDKKDQRIMIEAPKEQVREVPIIHPTCDALSSLGLRWYAVPLVSNMILTIGGIDYPCAPFNGFYMGTEIASRDFVDTKRYDLLPEVARALDLDPGGSNRQLWRDSAVTELNRAVLHSFDKAGVTIIDHHTASEQFMAFHCREQAAGRRVAADWRWIVPPQASATCEVFHLEMRNFHPVPNYYHDRAGDGWRLMPWYGDKHRHRLQVWTDRIVRRWKLWKRMPW